MAFFSSLADELAGAFDDGDPSASALAERGGGEGAPSLAEEFGLDMEMEYMPAEHDQDQGRAEREGEREDGIDRSKRVDGDENGHEDSLSIQTPPNRLSSLPLPLPLPSHSSLSAPRPHTLDLYQARAGRTPKSSWESYHTVPIESSPIFATPLRSPRALRALRGDLDESPLPQEQEIYEDFEDEGLQVPSLDVSPFRPPTLSPCTGKREQDRMHRTSLLSLRDRSGRGQEMREMVVTVRGPGPDPLVFLSESLATTSRFLSDLRKVDNAHNRRKDNGAGAENENEDEDVVAADEGVEMALQRHLGRLANAETMRDEQIRQLMIIGKEAEAVGWGNVELELDEVDQDYDDEDGKEKLLGWTGEAELVLVLDGQVEQRRVGRKPGPGQGQDLQQHDSSFVPVSVSEQLDVIHEVGEQDHLEHENADAEEHVDPHNLDAYLLLDEPFSPPSSTAVDDECYHHPLTPTTDPTTTTGAKVRANAQQPILFLPHTTSLLLSDTHALLSLLRSLTDSLHTSASVSTSLQRQVRGIRAGVEGWREREEAEENARKLIESYEGERVRRGLRGEESVEDGLKRECKEFGEALDGWGRRMDEIKRGVV